MHKSLKGKMPRFAALLPDFWRAFLCDRFVRSSLVGNATHIVMVDSWFSWGMG
jgi:hypothetical protein